MCYDTKRFAVAARFWAEAFEADPASADDLEAGHRHGAVCSAALAGSGKGKNDPPSDDDARSRLRARAREWLRADLGLDSKQIETGDPKARAEAFKSLQDWKVETDLVGLRDAEPLARLPEAERNEWRGLWAEVDALLKLADSVVK